MKKLSVEEGSVGRLHVCRRTKLSFVFSPKDMEHPRGKSRTVPGMSYSLRELVEKFAGGIDPMVSKVAQWNDEDDFDAEDLSKVGGLDLVERDELRSDVADRAKLFYDQVNVVADEAGASKMPGGKEIPANSVLVKDGKPNEGSMSEGGDRSSTVKE